MRGATSWLVAVVVLSWVPKTVQAQVPQATIAATARRAVFLLKGLVGDDHSLGTGFIISSDGKAITALHVIREMRNPAIRLASGDVFDSFTVLAVDERRDLAVIQLPGFDLPVLPLG